LIQVNAARGSLLGRCGRVPQICAVLAGIYLRILTLRPQKHECAGAVCLQNDSSDFIFQMQGLIRSRMCVAFIREDQQWVKDATIDRTRAEREMIGAREPIRVASRSERCRASGAPESIVAPARRNRPRHRPANLKSADV
jgi:hypothetical protein